MASVPETKPKWGWRAAARRLLVFCLFLYTVVLLLLLLLENNLIYHPVRATEDWVDPMSAGLAVEDVWLDSADGNRLHAWWCPGLSSGNGDAILYLHGNGGNLSYWSRALVNWRKQLGTAAFIVDYPGYGRSDGQPTEAGCYAAADAAYEWLTRTRELPPNKIIILGESLGSGPAVDLASRQPHAGLILLCPFTSVPDMAQEIYPWLPGRWLVRTQFNNLAKIGRCAGPVLIAHGTLDNIIPFSQGERLFAAAHEPKAFLAMPGQGHMMQFGPDFFAALKELLARARSSEAAAN